jgi:serine/threonine-protein kinase
LRLVHRDVSPQNILVGFDGGVKVIDFGVAKAAGSTSNTATGVLKGKYPYMSPEQAAGQPVDGRSDQFALGVVLWELLTGRRLFKGESDLMTLRLVRECQVPPPSRLNPQLPPGLDELVLKALAPTPEGRFRDCAAFRLALEDYILQQRLPASSAHLSAWLREVYADRIEREADPTQLDQLSEDTDLDAKSNPSRSSVRSLVQPLQSLPPPPPPPSSTGTPVVPGPRSLKEKTRHTQTMLPVVEPRRFRVLPMVAGVGALLISAGAALVYLRQSPPEPEPPPAVVARAEPARAEPVQPEPVQPEPVRAEPVQPESLPPEPVQPEPVRPEPAAQPQQVTLQVLSQPAGALVMVDGQQRGETPVDLRLAPDAPPVTVAWQLNGYQPVSRKVSAGDAPQVSVTLKPAGSRPPRRNSTPSQLGIKRDR